MWHGVSDQSQRQRDESLLLWRLTDRWEFSCRRAGAGQRWQFLRYNRIRWDEQLREQDEQCRHGISDQSRRQLQDPVLLCRRPDRRLLSRGPAGARQRWQFLWDCLWRRDEQPRHRVSDQSQRQLHESLPLCRLPERWEPSSCRAGAGQRWQFLRDNPGWRGDRQWHRIQILRFPQPSALSNQSNYGNPEIGYEYRPHHPVDSGRNLSVGVSQLVDLGNLVECPRRIGHEQYRGSPDSDQLRRSKSAARVLSV